MFHLVAVPKVDVEKHGHEAEECHVIKARPFDGECEAEADAAAEPPPAESEAGAETVGSETAGEPCLMESNTHLVIVTG